MWDSTTQYVHCKGSAKLAFEKKKHLTFTAFSVVQWSCLVALLVFCDILLAKIWMNRNMERVFYSTKAMETHLGSAD